MASSSTQYIDSDSRAERRARLLARVGLNPRAAPHELSDAAVTLSPQQTADMIGVTVKTLRNWRSSGDGPAYMRAGNRVSYLRSDVLAWLRENAHHGNSEASRNVPLSPVSNLINKWR